MNANRKPARTHVIRLVATIGDQRPTITMDEVRHAIAPRVPVDDGLLLSLEPKDGTDALYELGADMITRKVPGFLEHRVANTDKNHLSIFGFAPMPLLMLLGRTVGDKQPAEVYENHRHSGSWRWDDDGPSLEWSATFPARPIAGREVALLLSISAPIAMEGVRQTLANDFDVVELALPGPQQVPNIVRTRAQLRSFAEKWRATLNRIKAEYEPAHVHVFPAAPLSICLELGRRLLPKSDPELIIHDRFGPRFKRALTLRGPELPEVATASNPTSSNWREGLQQLFAAGFEKFELIAWLDAREPGIQAFLPSEGVSEKEIAHKAVRRLEQRSIIDEKFFDALKHHFSRTNRKAEVESIRAAWRRAPPAIG